jgi:hypothetical protein
MVHAGLVLGFGNRDIDVEQLDTHDPDGLHGGGEAADGVQDGGRSGHRTSEQTPPAQSWHHVWIQIISPVQPPGQLQDEVPVM